MKIVDKTKQEHSDMPDSMDGIVILEDNENGVIACPQEIAYMFSVSTPEQRVFNSHDNYDYTLLDKKSCKKPTHEFINEVIRSQVLGIMINKSLPEQAKTTLQSRLDRLIDDMQSTSNLDDAIRLALQIPLDTENT